MELDINKGDVLRIHDRKWEVVHTMGDPDYGSKVLYGLEQIEGDLSAGLIEKDGGFRFHLDMDIAISDIDIECGDQE